MDDPLTVSYPTGRKHCSGCGRWRPICDFGLREGHRLRSWCGSCERVRSRVRGGYKPRAVRCKRGHPLERDRWYNCRRCRQDRERQPEYLERQRIYRHAKGQVKGRLLKRKCPQRKGETLLLDAKPFGRWLDERVPRGSNDLGDWAVAHGLDASQVGKIRDGRQKTVHIDTVDRALVLDGGATHLSELYGELYLFEEAA